MSAVYYLFIFTAGLIAGSFIGALTYRLPRGLSILYGRSFCPKCKSKISWYDNIPLLSYALLNGRCRHCKKIISRRYPIIELSTAVIFVLLGYLVENCLKSSMKTSFHNSILCGTSDLFGQLTLLYLLILTSSLIAIFITDLEHKIIPDGLVFINVLTTFIFFPTSSC